MTPPRELGRYVKQARALQHAPVLDIAAALRAAEADAIERAAQAIEAIEGGGSLYRNGLHAAAARVRALVSPESPPAISETQYEDAAEARNEPAAPAPCTCHYEAAEFCRYHGPLLKAERASGVAPAPSAAEKRIAELEAALRKATVQIGILLDRMRGCDDEIRQGRRDKDGHGLSLLEGPAWIAEHRAALAARAATQKGEGK